MSLSFSKTKVFVAFGDARENVFVLVGRISSFKEVRYAIGQESDEIHQLLEELRAKNRGCLKRRPYRQLEDAG